jgi:hypothetical protein
MATFEEEKNLFEERKRHKGDVYLQCLDDSDDVEVDPSTYFYVSKKSDITYFQAFVEKYPPSNPENHSRLEGIERALFHPYGDEGNMFMNEAIFMILISNGYEFSNDLFALLVCGSIYTLMYDDFKQSKIDPNLKACVEYYCKLEININNESELMVQSHSFVHYMYDTESNNQEPYQDALLGIPSLIRSYIISKNKPLFPKFNCYI